MRELNQTELQFIYAGLDTGGYNTSFIVSNTVLGGILGIPIALLMGSEIWIAYSAGLFCTYGLSMLIAKSIDALLFDKQPLSL